MEQKWKAEVQALSSMKHSSSAPTMQSFLDNMMGSKKSAGPKVDRWGQMNGDVRITLNIVDAWKFWKLGAVPV